MTTPTRQPGLAATVGLYTSARLGLVALAAALLLLAGVPLLISFLVALIVALPLSMVLFRGLRARLDEALATTRDRRARERAVLQARLRGDAPAPVEGEPAEPGLEPAGPESDPESDVVTEPQADGRQH